MISVTQHTEETATTQHLAKEYSTFRCRGCANIKDERGGCARYVEGGGCARYVEEGGCVRYVEGGGCVRYVQVVCLKKCAAICQML